MILSEKMSAISISYLGSSKALKGNIDLPASKSISNRLLLIRALCEESFSITNLSEAGDTQILARALSSIQATSDTQTINVEDAGTAFRFMTAMLACRKEGQYTLSGSRRMHQRPIGELVSALRLLGADIQYLEVESFPPLQIIGRTLKGGKVAIESGISSQFVSALCMIAPMLRDGLEISLLNDVVSSAYITMTLQLMSDFGIHYSREPKTIKIPGQKYQAKAVTVENDWSSMSFFYAFAMLADEVDFTVRFLQEKSLQGDSFIRQFAAGFGIISRFNEQMLHVSKKEPFHQKYARCYHLSEVPDMAIPVIVACAIRFPELTFSGLQHLQYKESDRLYALKNELKKVNIDLLYKNDLLCFDSSNYIAGKQTVHFNCYQDHRIAMALSLFAFEGFTVILNDPACVQKSFPHYFEELSKLGFNCLIS